MHTFVIQVLEATWRASGEDWFQKGARMGEGFKSDYLTRKNGDWIGAHFQFCYQIKQQIR